MLLQDTRRESGVASGKARTRAPVGKEDLGLYEGKALQAREVPFIPRHTQSTNGTQPAFGKQGRLHGRGDLGDEPKRL